MSDIIYEQPFQELPKILVRVEQLFFQLHAQQQQQALIQAMQAFIAIVKISERPDLKAKLTKYLHQQRLQLSNFLNHPNIDNHKLQHTLETINQHLSRLKRPQGLINDKLSQNPLFRVIKTEMNTSGGLAFCGDLAFQAWLAQPITNNLDQLQTWSQELQYFDALQQFLLKLIRNSKALTPIVCDHFFYSQPLNPSSELALVRIKLKDNPSVMPEISAGRHHIAIHFKKINFSNFSYQVEEYPVGKFELACCG